MVCTLVLAIGVAASLGAYFAVRRAVLAAAGDRVVSASARVANALQGAARRLDALVDSVAADPALAAAAASRAPALRKRAGRVLDSLARTAPGIASVELWSPAGARLLWGGADLARSAMPPVPAAFDGIDSARIGPLSGTEAGIGYTVIAPVRDAGRTVAFLVMRRRSTGTEQAAREIGALIGKSARLYAGNDTGDVWTDLVHVVTPPPVPMTPGARRARHYVRPGVGAVMGGAERIAGTPWTVLVELPQADVLRDAHALAVDLILITAVLVLIGGAWGWAISRSLTRPLTRLADAAGTIAAGDYSRRVALERHDEIGEVGAAFNHMADTVERMHGQLEREVAERTTDLQVVNRELEAFSYSVSHDLRAPLRSIDGFSQALLEDYGGVVDAAGRRHLERVRAASQRMGALIDDLLGLARVARGAVELAPVDLSAMAAEIVAELRERDPERAVTVDIAPGMVAQGDRRLLHVALGNLLQNAWKFTRRSAAPRVEFGRAERDGETAYFVRDNGVGFDMQYADKLFAPFQRLHSFEDFEGTGIGLATVQRVVHRHGGAVWAEAAVDRGATIWFTLPGPHRGNGAAP